MKIGVDIDNVLANFNEALLYAFLEEDKKRNNSGIINQDVYISKGMFDWGEEESLKFYKENIENIVENLDVIQDAPFYIKKLREQGYQIYIITGRNNGDYSNPEIMTKQWLDKYGIEYDRLIITNIHNPEEKAQICLKNNISIMIDDSSRIGLSIKEAGLTSLLMDTPYNKKTKGLIRVHSWQEIYEYITNKKINVILDTDTYNECDDQFALAYLLKSQNIFNIEAITVAPYSHKERNETVVSGQEKSYNEILKICSWLNFDTTNKVFKGAEDYICNGYEKNNDAVNKIIEIALKNSKTYILAIGAITNIALAIQKEPQIIDNIEVIWLGGHSLLQRDNREYNFRQDIKAVQIIFESKVKLTIIPCKNVASNLGTSIYELSHHLKDKNELCNYLIDRFYNDGYHGIQERRVIWDISVIAYMINKDWFTVQQISCPKINDDTSYIPTTDHHKITMVNYIDVNKVYTDLFKKLQED